MAQTQENKISKMNSKHEHTRLGIYLGIWHAKKSEVLGKNININTQKHLSANLILMDRG